VEQTKKNYWRLKKSKLEGDILNLSDELKLPPAIIVRELLNRKGLTRSQINKALSGKFEVGKKFEKVIEIANANDPVFSPKGNEYSKWRGDEGEKILALWLDHQNMKYERDLGKGIPDFLLKKNIKIGGEDLKWIESKASFGDLKTRKSDERQFKKFDGYGHGVVIYWFGVQGQSKRRLITYMDILKLLPKNLQNEVKLFLNQVPPEFKHLIRD
jgi:hypothetical protein